MRKNAYGLSRANIAAMVCILFITALIVLLTPPVMAASKGVPAQAASTESSTAPMISKIFPEDCEEDIALDAKIMAVFNKKMRDEDINEFTVTLNDGVSDISTSVRYNSELTKAVITPLENLQPDHGYFVTISRTIRDSNGSAMLSDKVWKFRTIKKSDTNPPVIIDVSPTVSAPGVPCDTKIEVMFNKKMYDSSINENTITVKCGREKVIGAIRYFEQANKAVFSPINPLKPDSLFEVVISAEICDASKNKLAQGQTYTFKTASKMILKNTNSSEDENESAPRISKTGEAGAVTPSSSKMLDNPKIKKLMGKMNKNIASVDAAEEEEIVAENDESPLAKSKKAEIVEMFPAPGSDMVNTDDKIIVRFNKKMNPGTFNIFNFSLQEKDEYIFGKVEYNAAAKTATYTPSGNLKINRKYKVTVSEKIEDADGNQLGQNYYWDFTTLKQVAQSSIKKTFDSPKSMSKDTTGPNIITLNPRENADNIAATAQITAAFDEAIKDFSLNSFTFRVLNGETEVPGKLYYDTSQKKAIFTPKAPLDEGTAYNVHISTGIMDLSGNYMQREKKWKFIVGKNWSGRSPMITSVVPEKGADGVELGSPITVSFDRRMKASSITPYSFFVTDGTRSVQGKVSYDEQNNSATFAPWSTYSQNRVYSVTLAKTIEDREGMALAETTLWQFKTGNGMRSGIASSGQVTSVAAGGDANMQIKVQKQMGSELITQMGDRSAATAAAKSELGSEMNLANPEKTQLRDLVPVADVKDRMSVSDKGAYGNVKANTYREDSLAVSDNAKFNAPLAAEPAASPLESAPDEAALRAHISDKSAYGDIKMRRIKDTVDQTDVYDDAMSGTLKDQIANFLSDEAKSQAKLGTAVDALASNSDPVADARNNGLGANVAPANADEEDPAAVMTKERTSANAEISDRVKTQITDNYNGKNIVYTKADGLSRETETARPKAAFVQMSDPPSKEDSIYSQNPVESKRVVRQPKLSDNDDADLIKLEKVHKYGVEEQEPMDAEDGAVRKISALDDESLIDSPLREDKEYGKTPPAVDANMNNMAGNKAVTIPSVANAEPAMIPQQCANALSGAKKPAAGEPVRPKGMINGVPIEDIIGEGGIEGMIADNAAAAGDPSTMSDAGGSGRPVMKKTVVESAATLKTYENQGLSDAGQIPSENEAKFLVIAIFPNKNSKGIPLDSTITAVFNQDIDVASLNGTTFAITGAEGTVAGKLLYNGRMKKAIFRPNSPLQASTRYEVTLASAIKNATGQALMPLKWVFTTAE